MVLLLTNIGECLLAEMFNRSENVQHMIFSRLHMSAKTNLLAISEVPINYDGNYRFDGAHKIDVAVLLPDSQKCIAIEAKLGKDRLTASTFNNRFLKTCGISAHSNPSITGSMIAILEGKLPESCKRQAVIVKHQDKNFNLHDKWVLVVLRQIKDNWDSRVRPSLRNGVTIAFESIVESYGGPEKFNELVSDLVKGDYYNDWF